MLILSRRCEESIIIDDHITVTVVEIKGDHVKLGIKAPSDINIFRHEVYEAIRAENLAAAQGSLDPSAAREELTSLLGEDRKSKRSIQKK